MKHEVLCCLISISYYSNASVANKIKFLVPPINIPFYLKYCFIT